MAVRLFYHPDSDSLFLDEEDDVSPFCDDVTHDPKMRVAAKLRGIKFDLLPEVTSEVVPKHSFSNAIVESYRRWHRKPADLYPTPVNGTESLIPALDVIREQYADLDRPFRIWEPACGDGRIARVLEWHGYEVLASDLRSYPGHGIPDMDFLADHLAAYGWDPRDPGNDQTIDMIVTNPPFSHAEQFIRKALSITPNVAMLLKATYWNAASRLPFFAEHRPKFVLPLTFRLAFLEKERGKSPLMDCVWVVWSEFGDDRICAFEPLPKRVYPGYHGAGVKSGMAALEEALLDLTEVVRDAVQ